MTVQEWDSFVNLYRETWKVHADLATHTKYLEKCEEHISQAEDRRSDTLLMQLFADDPRPSIGSQLT